LNEAGLGGFTYRGVAHSAYPHSFNLINPGEVHTGYVGSESGWTFRNLYISLPLLKRILVQLEWSSQGLPYFRQPAAWDQPLRAAFYQAFQALSAPASQLEQQTLLLEFLAQLLARQAQSGYCPLLVKSERGAIAKTRTYLEAHYTENLSIEALAQQAGLSPYYLIRSFHQQVGLPPHSYQRHWQLLQAKRDLQTPKPISEVALDHGFYDQSHLSRHFKRVFGVTPGQYRQGNSVQDG
ncbi:MAG: helix-turn-helix transcriptional regulator, partial [Cyanobacteria bacterium Co-bin8]|nr:helix-turn-helix transcriptional regulator [Cyanobacteria bacterium Co-bin8]